MADDDDLQRQTLEQREAGPTAGEAAAAALAALASGFALRVQELVHLADSVGDITIPVQSSVISELRYNLQTRVVGAAFVDGSDYEWSEISAYNFLEWLNASSKGAFFNERVRGQWGTWPIGSTKQKRVL